MKSLENGYCMVVLDSRHRRFSVKMVTDEDGVELLEETVCMRYAILVDEKPISSSQSLKISKKENISTVVLQRKATFADKIQSLLSYAQAVQQNYVLRFVDGRITSIVEDMMSSMFLVADSRAAYIRNVGVGKMMIKHQVCSSFLGS